MVQAALEENRKSKHATSGSVVQKDLKFQNSNPFYRPNLECDMETTADPHGKRLYKPQVTLQNGAKYTGEWLNGLRDGYGVQVWASGDRYEGEWKKCLKHGSGTMMFHNGDTYIGDHVKGKMHGQGQYIWANGSIYIGEFKNGFKHGKGKWKKDKSDQNSNQYEGGYENDLKKGFGIFRWKSGNLYKGRYEDDERHGYGEMFWTDGSVYKGMWHKGIQHGKGRMEFPDGKVKEGIFQNNIFQGPIHNRLNLYQKKPLQNSNYSSLDKLANTTTTTYESDYVQSRTTSNFDSVKKKYSKSRLRDSKLKTMNHQNRFLLNKKRLKTLERKTRPKVVLPNKLDLIAQKQRRVVCSSMSKGKLSNDSIEYDNYGGRVKTSIPQKRSISNHTSARNLPEDKSSKTSSKFAVKQYVDYSFRK